MFRSAPALVAYAFAFAVAPAGCTSSGPATAVYAVAHDTSTLDACERNATKVLTSIGYLQISSAGNPAGGTAMVFGTKDSMSATVVCNPPAAATTVVFNGPPGGEMDGALESFGGAYTAAAGGSVKIVATPAPAPGGGPGTGAPAGAAPSP